MKHIGVVLTALAMGAAGAAHAQPTCTSPGRLVQWPTAAQPVWAMCLYAPSVSSGTNGSGIELRDVYYNGHQVFKRAHAPILNVKYDPGGSCNCFRDWSDQEVKFEIRDSGGNVVNMSGTGNYFETSAPPRTVCDVGVTSVDIPPTTGFRGVAAEKLSDRLILTTQVEAGWYRYQMKWYFYQDGRIEPRFGFGAVNQSSCLSTTHRHHNYWRFDFDIDGGANDAIGNLRPGAPQVQLEDQRNLPDTTKKPAYVVHDTATGRGYFLQPGPENTDLPLDSFSIGDSWMLKYSSNQSTAVTAQIDDGQGLGGCPLSSTFLNFDNNEVINDQDLVVWYRGGAVHLGGDLDGCTWVGPALVPVGD
jgi:hypothetical protein